MDKKNNLDVKNNRKKDYSKVISSVRTSKISKTLHDRY
jgi:hypothetical protein